MLSLLAKKIQFLDNVKANDAAITELRLSNPLDEHAVLLAEALTFNTVILSSAHLLSLSATLYWVVSSLILESTKPLHALSETGAQSLAHVLTANRTIRSLSLWNNDIQTLGALTILRSTPEWNLLSLDLSGNTVRDEGALALVPFLSANCCLHTLKLSNNALTSACVNSLALSLESNTCLRLLDLVKQLSCNAVGNDGAKALSNLLEVNHHMRRLILYDGQITTQGAVDLALALECNRSVVRLDLRWNAFELNVHCALHIIAANTQIEDHPSSSEREGEGLGHVAVSSSTPSSLSSLSGSNSSSVVNVSASSSSLASPAISNSDQLPCSSSSSSSSASSSSNCTTTNPSSIHSSGTMFQHDQDNNVVVAADQEESARAHAEHSLLEAQAQAYRHVTAIATRGRTPLLRLLSRRPSYNLDVPAPPASASSFHSSSFPLSDSDQQLHHVACCTVLTTESNKTI